MGVISVERSTKLVPLGEYVQLTKDRVVKITKICVSRVFSRNLTKLIVEFYVQ